MIGLTQLRSDASTYPFVSALIDIADEVRTLLGSRRRDKLCGRLVGIFIPTGPWTARAMCSSNLDPLWSDARIDFIGIDNYMPLADWRDGTQHVDL